MSPKRRATAAAPPSDAAPLPSVPFVGGSSANNDVPIGSKRSRSPQSTDMCPAKVTAGALIDANPKKPLSVFFDVLNDPAVKGPELAMFVVKDPRCGLELKTLKTTVIYNVRRSGHIFGAGLTPLMLAVFAGRLDVVEALLAAGANPSLTEEKYSYTIVHIAALDTKLGMLKALIAKGFDIEAKGKDGNTPLLVAATIGSKSAIQTLVAKQADLTAKTVKNGMNALHLAASAGHRLAVGALIEHGIPLDTLTSDGFTALHLAYKANRYTVPDVSEFSLATVELLIAKGANIHAKGGKDQQTPLHIAIEKHHDVKALLAHGAADGNVADAKGFTPLHLAVNRGNIELVESLLAKGANPNAFTHKGDSPLSLAGNSFRGSCAHEIMKVLKNAGAQLELAAPDGSTALHKAVAESRFEENIQALLDLGANVRAVDKKGRTPMSICVGRSYVNIEAANMLMKAGADVNTKASDGRTIIHRLAQEGYSNEMARQIKKGANVNAVARGKATPLHDARNSHAIFVLVVNGADINAVDCHGDTPLHYAAGNLNHGITYLVDEGANIYARNRKNETPWDLFIQCDGINHLDPEVIEMIRQHLQPK